MQKSKEASKAQKRRLREFVLEAENQKRLHTGEQRQMKKQHETDKKQNIRDIKEEQKKLQKEFKGQLKTRDSNFQEEKKKMKKEKYVHYRPPLLGW